MRDDGVIEVWAPTESPEYTRISASSAAGVDTGQVHVHVPFAGGSFGLHSSSAHDPTAEVVQIANALDWKHPIKVQSLRGGGVQVPAGTGPCPPTGSAPAPTLPAG